MLYLYSLGKVGCAGDGGGGFLDGWGVVEI